MTISVVSALCAAVFFAAASAFQHRSAGETADLPSFQVGQLRNFALRTLRHPAWVAGFAADCAGAGLHALALNQGPLVLVQPLLVSGVVFAFPFRHWLDRRRPMLAEVLWCVALTAGLVTFLLAAAPTSSTVTIAARAPAVVMVSIILGIGIIAATLVARRGRRRRAATSLGIATGLGFAATAALLKTVTDIVQHHPGSLLTTWTVYALAAVGVSALLLNQLAFQAGPLRASLPAITTVDPIASLIIGIAVYDERLRGGLLAVSAESIGLLVVVIATIALARSGTDQTLAAPRTSGSALKQ